MITVGSPVAASDAAPAANTGIAPAEPAAAVRVTGMGWWRNRELRQTLRLLEPEEGPLTEINSAFVEDAVVLLQSALERDGYLRSAGVARMFLAGAAGGEYAWTAGEIPLLPRDLRADRVEFVLAPGVQYYFERLAFTGLAALDVETTRSYFVEEGLLLGGTAARRFTTAGLRGGVNSLQVQLIRMGYTDARVTVTREVRDDTTGGVQVSIAVEQGPRYLVRAVVPPDDAPGELGEELRAACAGAAGAIDSPLWQQDFKQTVRGLCYARAYASAEVDLVSAGEPVVHGDEVQRDYRLVLVAGPQVRVGAVQFAGDEHTRESVLLRATRVEAGDLFVRSEVERDRLRIGQLGAFRSVQAETDPVAPEVWDLTYRVRPAQRFEASLLAGYGSYEGIRGGFEAVHNNFLGQAHRGRLQFITSQKSTYGDYLYTMPQVFGMRTDAALRVFGLEREEVSFIRRESGVNLGVRRHISWIGTDVMLRYQLESVRADEFGATTYADVPTDSNVGSITLGFTRDRTDNPVAPHRGYFLGMAFETAAQAIGGEVDFQRFEGRWSWHRAIGREQYLHVGLRHDAVWAMNGTPSTDIPLAKRFFPGGEGSIRGYVEGKAAPRAPDGTVIGAEVSTIVNAEFERGLTKNIAAVVFVDAGLTAASLSDYPGNETRISIGLGLRYNSAIGPARMEYGYNVVSEPGDGRDAWHFALGFPF